MRLLVLEHAGAVHLDVPGDREVGAVVLQVDERRVEVLVRVDGHVTAAAVDRGDVRVVARPAWRGGSARSVAVAVRERRGRAERQGEHGDEERREQLGQLRILSRVRFTSVIGARPLVGREGLDACSVRRSGPAHFCAIRGESEQTRADVRCCRGVTRIAFIGAGSIEFTRDLLGDLLTLRRSSASSHVALHDIDRERLETAEAMARWTARAARRRSRRSRPTSTAARRSTAPTSRST